MRFLVFLVAPLALIGAWYFTHLHRSVPPDGTVVLPHAMQGRVTLLRDTNGAVHIQAADDLDAFYAVGYAQARDRLWQLEIQRRLARGRLSEIFGKDSLDADVWFRTLGLYDSARSAWPALSGRARASLTAYTRGVNAGIAASRVLPVEFGLFDVEPEPWTELDSLAWIKVFALNLGGNFRKEIDHYLAGRVLTPSQLSALFPEYPADAPVTVPSASDAAGLAALAASQVRLARMLQVARPGTGSNAWAVAGRLTNDGGAILANDPHLGLQIPSQWYPISIDTPTLHVSGMSLVGLPIVVFGHNAQIAWGGTNMMADTQDLYVEHSDESGTRYEIDGAWRPFDVHEEVIHVRADFPSSLREPYKPVSLAVRRTVHGPVISDYFRAFDAPVSLRWTALDPGDTSYEAFFRLGYAHNWKQFNDALAYQVAPALNMLYADRAGHIGYVGSGRIPVRKKGDGTLPVPGWSDGYGWSTPVPASQMPRSYDPPSGFLVSANNRVAGPSYPYYISHDWASPARAVRIEHLLQERINTGVKLTPVDMERIQVDTLDLDARAMMDKLRERLPTQGHASQAARYLMAWHGEMDASSQGASIFHAWMRHLRQRLFANVLRSSWNNPEVDKLLRRLEDNLSLNQMSRIVTEDHNAWCGMERDASRGGCESVLASSLDDALDELHKLYGDWNMQSWHWGKVQKTLYASTPFHRIKPLDRIFDRRVPNGGSANSINVAVSSFVEGEGYVQTFGAGFRQVIAMGPVSVDHEYMNSTGQSGNILSRHYDDMVQPFQDGQYFRLTNPADNRPGAQGTP